MDNEFDYKDACEILEKALKDADRILRRAQLLLSFRRITGASMWAPDDEADLQAEIDAFNQARHSHTE